MASTTVPQAFGWNARSRSDVFTPTATSNNCPSHFPAPLGQATVESRANVVQMIERLHALPKTIDTNAMLTGIAAVRVEQWADEALRLSATELREYRTVRRRVLRLCLIYKQRAKVLDDLCTVFIKTIRKLKYPAKSALQE